MTRNGRQEARRDGEEEAPQSDACGQDERVLTSAELFAGRQEIKILHQGESYRLRITRNGKLILHK